MSYDESLISQIRQLLGRKKNLSEQKMFGGVAFLLSGNVCCGAWAEFLILRLGEDMARQVLGEQNTRPFDITGKPLRGWAMVEPAGWQDAAKLRRWVAWAVEFTNTLPAK